MQEPGKEDTIWINSCKRKKESELLKAWVNK